MKKLINPKDIIMSTLREKMSGYGVNKIVLMFNRETEEYNCSFTQDGQHDLKVEISQGEINMIKRMYLQKLIRRIEHTIDENITYLILEVNFEKETFNIFYENNKDKVYKFDY